MVRTEHFVIAAAGDERGLDELVTADFGHDTVQVQH